MVPGTIRRPVRTISILTQACLMGLLTPLGSLALDCPNLPEQSRKDWDVQVKAAVGKIGPVRGAELETATRTVTQDLMSKLPQADKVYLEQMMYATYCSALRDDRTLPESEKAIRIRAYNLELRKTLYPSPSKPGSSTPGSSGPRAARLELSQLSVPYTPEAFVDRVEQGDIHAVQLFLTSGIDPNTRDRNGKPALMLALGKGHTQIVEALLKAKADVNAQSQGETAVSWIAAQGNVDALRAWLDRGANAKTLEGAFLKAAWHGHRPVLRLLLARGVDPKLVGPEALEKAVRGARSDSGAREPDRIETVTFLLDAGVDVNARDRDGWTALTTALNGKSTAMVRALLERGADPNLKCNCGPCNPWEGVRGCTPLMFAANKHGREMVSALLAKGAQVNDKTDEGCTALMVSRDAEIIRALVKAGADVNARDREGRTALMWVMGYGTIGVADVPALLEAGVDVHVKDNEGRTALTWAAISGSEDGVRLLLDRGAELNAKTVRGRTPLMFAARNGFPGVVRVLLDRGARVSEVDVTGKTALQLAEERGQGPTMQEIVHLLKQAGAK